MSKVLLDTNVLIYSIDEESKYFKKAQNLISEQNRDLFTTSKNLSEFLAVITRFPGNSLTLKNALTVLQDFKSFFKTKEEEYTMTLTEEIFQHIQVLPESLKAEVLDFVEYLELKSKKTEEDIDWSTLSLSFAMRGMESEQTSYTIDDLKERFT